MPTFMEKLQARWGEGKFVCVGLDSDYTKIPVEAGTYRWQRIIGFNQAIVDATKDLVCAYKPNCAFYEEHGEDGERTLSCTCSYIRTQAPGVPIILDGKRGDIGNTNRGYVNMAFECFGADAVTINPYLGMEAMKPFLDRADKGVIVLCRTSNPGAGEFQDLPIEVPLTRLAEGLPLVPEWLNALEPAVSMPLYKHVAHQIRHHWNRNGNCGLVAGATYPDELMQIRRIVGDMPILIPGIGAQGGDLEATVKAGVNSRGQGIIINGSRGIIFADDPRAETLKLHQAINAVLATL